MRKLLLFLWLLLPAAVAAYHFGPGQDAVRCDEAAAALARAEAAAAQARALAAAEGDDAARDLWTEAEAAYSEALDLLPKGRSREARAIRLDRAKAQMLVSRLADARSDLEALVAETAGDPGADPAFLAEARSALANSRYYTTWLLKLEGASREEWEPEIEAARQTYKLLAASAEKSGDQKAGREARENLESAVRLARMDTAELQGLPLPSQ